MISLIKVRFSYSIYKSRAIVLTIYKADQEDEGFPESLPHLQNISIYREYPESSMETHLSPPAIYCEKIKSDLFHDIRLREETEYEFTISVPLDKDSIKQRRRANPVFPFENRSLSNYISFNSSRLWIQKEGITHISGRMNFRRHVGGIKLSLDNFLSSDIHYLDVVSYKISYETDFRTLINEITDFHSELALSLDNPTEAAFHLEDTQDEISDQVFLMHLRRLMEKDRLPQALDTILANLNYKNSYYFSQDKLSMVYSPDLNELVSNYQSYNWIKGGPLRNLFKEYSPEELPYSDFERTIDTNENRYLKFVLEELQYRFITLIKKVPRSKKATYYFLELSIEYLDEVLSNPVFRQIGQFRFLSNSMVIQRRNGYKDLYSYIQALEQGVKLESSILNDDNVFGDLKSIDKLYEYWIFFQIIDALVSFCKCRGGAYQDLIKIVDQRLYLYLKQGGGSKVYFHYKNLDICLYYNKNFVGHIDGVWEGTYDDTNLHPDFNIEIFHTKLKQKHLLHFDAKYKLDLATLSETLKATNFSGQNHAIGQKDIATAHFYKDAILGTRGVYIIYPDIVTDKLLFIRNADSKYGINNIIPSIGAFPLNPGSSISLQKKMLTNFLQQAFDIIEVSKDYQEEEGFIR